MAASFDAIVIGGGHNGLVAAAYLARSGARTLVLEARGTTGGAATTEAPWPDAPEFRVTRLMTMSIADLLDDWFESPQVKGALAVNGVIGTWAGPYEPGTAYVMAHHSIGDIGDGHLGNWDFQEGGMGAVADAIGSAARQRGATVRTGARVARALLEGGRAAGVVLDNGEDIRAGVGVTSQHPQTACLAPVRPVGPRRLERRAAHRGTAGLRRPHDRLLQRGGPELQELDPAHRYRRPLRDGARVRPGRRQHLPRRAVAGAALPHAPGARLRRLPHPGAQPVLRQLGHPRGRRRVRHSRHAGGPGGHRRQEGRPEGHPAPTSCPAAMTGETPAAARRLAPAAAGIADPGPQERDLRSPLLLGPDHDPGTYRPAMLAMLEARSVALVGASSLPGSLGERMLAEVSRSPAAPRIYPVNPRYQRIAGRRCPPSLADLPDTVDLVLLGVPDSALAEQLSLAARRGDRSAVIFGGAYEVPAVTPGTAGLRARLADIAHTAG